MKDLAARRLRAQRLIGEPFKSPVEAVRRLTAVQSQDYPAAKWALGLRSRRATDAGIDRLFDEGDILRTHVMRPTWHFVLPEDVKWLLDLTAPRIRRGLVARHRQLELDDRTIARASAAFAKALTGGRRADTAVLPQPRSGPAPGPRVVVGPLNGRSAERDCRRGRSARSPPHRRQGLLGGCQGRRSSRRGFGRAPVAQLRRIHSRVP